MTAVFKDAERSESEHTLATNILADFAADDPDRLAELIMVADPKAYVSLVPDRGKAGREDLARFRAELAKTVTHSWNDPPLNPSVDKARARARAPVRAGPGDGCRPFRFLSDHATGRVPHECRGAPRLGIPPRAAPPLCRWRDGSRAAIWARDERNWRISSGLTAEEVRRQDDQNRKDGFVPVDVAGYVAIEKDGKPADRHVALWVEKSATTTPGCTSGSTADRVTEVEDRVQGGEADSPNRPRHDGGRREHALLRCLGAARRTEYHGPDLSRPAREETLSRSKRT